MNTIDAQNKNEIPVENLWYVNFEDQWMGLPHFKNLIQQNNSFPLETSLKFSSIFHDTIEICLFIKDPLEINFPRKIEDYYKNIKINSNISKNLSIVDTLKIVHRSIGCFHSTLNMFRIYKKNKNLVLDKYDKEYGWTSLQLSNIKMRLKSLIKKGKALNKIHSCTSSDIYYFENNQKVFSFIDSSCEWNSLHEFLKE